MREERFSSVTHCSKINNITILYSSEFAKNRVQDVRRNDSSLMLNGSIIMWNIH